MPRVIQERQTAAREDYLKNILAVFQDLDAAGKNPSPAKAKAAIAAAARRLGRSANARPEQKFDPSRLPFRIAKPTARKPAPPRKPLPGKALSALAKSAAPPAAADLAANEDVQITPDIRALSASLENQPLKIYDWVRNNIEYVPTYGSVQGSEMTLVAKRGNAFDTASLLIALLRAAGVPARYATGTVEIPAAAAMSWVGGAKTSNVAQQVLGLGGVPNVGLAAGGAVTALRIDHVWVEAFLDYIPSRGAVNRQGDTWVPMDPSYKLHNFTPRSSFYDENPIGDVLRPGDRLFDVDESLGKISNVDPDILDQRLGEWGVLTADYLAAHGGAAAAPGLLGGKSIVPAASTNFAGSLPYRVVTRGTAVDTLPAGLRHAVTLNGLPDSFSVKLSLPALNSGQLSIQFEPATQADASALASARSNGSSSLPVYLVNVVPVVKLDGVEQGRGAAVRMGSPYMIDAVLQGPDGATTVPFQVVAGDEIVAGVTGNGVAREVIAKRFAEKSVDNASEYLHQIALNYWMQCDYLGEASAKSHGVQMLRLPSVGLFSSPLSVSYLFGAPLSGVYQGRSMDVRQSLLGVAGENRATIVDFAKQAGTAGSYLEGAVFDQFKDGTSPAIKGISSVHLLSAAMSQGIPVYRITSANWAAVLPLLTLSSTVKSDIASSVSQGKTVMVSERNVDMGPWAGVGYIIQDETTGAGAYLISGGTAGGGQYDCLKDLTPVFDVIVAVLLFLPFIALIIGAIIVLAPELALAGSAAAIFLLISSALSGLSSAGPQPVA